MKSKKKKAPISKKAAEAKAYADWLASLERMQPKFARQSHPAEPKRKKLEYTLSTPAGRSNGHEYTSLSTPGGSTAARKTTEYTGTSMLGVGTMHKSNMIPLFNTDAAKDVASMRR